MISAAAPAPTFATSEQAEPRDWGYMGLLAFTAVLLLRPQDRIAGLASLHLAELFAITGNGTIPVNELSAEQSAALKKLQEYERRVAKVSVDLQEKLIEPIEEKIEKELFARAVR